MERLLKEWEGRTESKLKQQEERYETLSSQIVSLHNMMSTSNQQLAMINSQPDKSYADVARTLQEAPMDLEIDMTSKSMTWDEDRGKINFLVKQAKLMER